MANNDMEVIMYKVLNYLYKCMKADVIPNKEDLIRDCDLVNIPENYWTQVVIELCDRGFVKGIHTRATKSGPLIFVNPDVRITFDGVEFLKENSTMKKVKDFLGKTYEIVLSQAIQSLLSEK